MSTDLALPTTGDASAWTDSEKALVEAAGLVSHGHLAPRPTVEAFLMHCRRTGLDPIARQIYCIERGGKWTTQVSIDGARLVAERSGQYRGQTPVQWTSDGREWLEVWLAKEPPAAARVGVYREGFTEPLYAVATFDAYNAGSPIWRKMPALMIGKCAEMLALRKAFPQDLSGLYSSEEMEQAGGRALSGTAAQKPIKVEREPSEDWAGLGDQATSVDQLRAVHTAARDKGELGLDSGREGLTVDAYLRKLKADTLAVTEGPVADEKTGEVIEAEVESEEPSEDSAPVLEWETVTPGGDADASTDTAEAE